MLLTDFLFAFMALFMMALAGVYVSLFLTCTCIQIFHTIYILTCSYFTLLQSFAYPKMFLYALFPTHSTHSS